MNTYQARAAYPGMDEYAKNIVRKNRSQQEELTPKEQEQLLRRLRIGVRLRRERLLWGLTQEQLSHILGISANYLGQIERGNRELSRKMEEKICQFFHIDRNELFNTAVEDMPVQVSEDSFMFPELNQMEIMRLLSSCSPEELALCGQILRYLLMCLRKSDINDFTDEQAATVLGIGTVH